MHLSSSPRSTPTPSGWATENPPKVDDFKGWANILPERLTEAGRLERLLGSPQHHALATDHRVEDALNRDLQPAHPTGITGAATPDPDVRKERRDVALRLRLRGLPVAVALAMDKARARCARIAAPCSPPPSSP